MDPTTRTPTLPRKVVPPARPPLVGVTPSRPPGSRLSDAGKFWRKTITRRIRNNPGVIRRGLAGPRRPPEDIPVVDLSDEENVPPSNTASSSARAAGPTVRLIEVFPPHTFRLVRSSGAGRSTTIATAGAAAPAITPEKGIAGTAAPTAPSLAPATERPITKDHLPHTSALATPEPMPTLVHAGTDTVPPGEGRTMPRMPRDPFFIIRTAPREERDVVVDGCLIRVPIGTKRWRTRIGKIKYALRLDPATGTVRHWVKAPTVEP
ncbi:PREDICTED: neural cell adhesion molecule 1-like [Vollenhovia emeryi]|uniref:neural cell adhesion molecule 1-like n=1 Tax=Vollenhovia emeryi TaxID=411798 RepID=UPI0005F43A93|nr:PREDICTED: neural cell adhesion molecule 1-like [Vollenhovia emeryi]